MAPARGCGRTTAHLGNSRKRRGFSGLPVATSKRRQTISTVCERSAETPPGSLFSVSLLGPRMCLFKGVE